MSACSIATDAGDPTYMSLSGFLDRIEPHEEKPRLITDVHDQGGSLVGFFTVLALRGLLLWITVPIASILWPAVGGVGARRGVTFSLADLA